MRQLQVTLLFFVLDFELLMADSQRKIDETITKHEAKLRKDLEKHRRRKPPNTDDTQSLKREEMKERLREQNVARDVNIYDERLKYAIKKQRKLQKKRAKKVGLEAPTPMSMMKIGKMGFFPPKPNSLGLILFIEALNEAAFPVKAEATVASCCVEVDEWKSPPRKISKKEKKQKLKEDLKGEDSPNRDCGFLDGVVFPDAPKTILPETMELILVWIPTLFPFELIGHCEISVRFNGSFFSSERLEFDPGQRRKKGGKRSRCKTPDLDPRRRCAPHDCHAKYLGSRDAFDARTGRCIAGPTCYFDEGDAENSQIYDEELNVCRSILTKISGAEVDALNQIRDEEVDEVVDVTEFRNVKCVHGRPLADGTGCECDAGWKNPDVDQNGYDPDTYVHPLCSIKEGGDQAPPHRKGVDQTFPHGVADIDADHVVTIDHAIDSPEGGVAIEVTHLDGEDSSSLPPPPTLQNPVHNGDGAARLLRPGMREMHRRNATVSRRLKEHLKHIVGSRTTTTTTTKKEAGESEDRRGSGRGGGRELELGRGEEEKEDEEKKIHLALENVKERGNKFVKHLEESSLEQSSTESQFSRQSGKNSVSGIGPGQSQHLQDDEDHTGDHTGDHTSNHTDDSKKKSVFGFWASMILGASIAVVVLMICAATLGRTRTADNGRRFLEEQKRRGSEGLNRAADAVKNINASAGRAIEKVRWKDGEDRRKRNSVTRCESSKSSENAIGSKDAMGSKEADAMRLREVDAIGSDATTNGEAHRGANGEAKGETNRGKNESLWDKVRRWWRSLAGQGRNEGGGAGGGAEGRVTREGHKVDKKIKLFRSAEDLQCSGASSSRTITEEETEEEGGRRRGRKRKEKRGIAARLTGWKSRRETKIQEENERDDEDDDDDEGETKLLTAGEVVRNVTPTTIPGYLRGTYQGKSGIFQERKATVLSDTEASFSEVELSSDD